MSSESLYCPACGAHHGPDACYCQDCSMALPAADKQLAADAQERSQRARKIDKRYTEGELVKVAFGRHQADSEMIQGLLLEHGIPSMTKRSGGFDVPDFLAAGPRDVFVPQSGAQAARQILGDMATGDLSGAAPNPAKIFAGLMAGLLVLGIILLIVELSG